MKGFVIKTFLIPVWFFKIKAEAVSAQKIHNKLTQTLKQLQYNAACESDTTKNAIPQSKPANSQSRAKVLCITVIQKNEVSQTSLK